MKLLRKQEGFTLIEMMVVIAVIGILSAAVLAGLGPSRQRARETRIIADLQQARTLAESLYNPSSNDPYNAAKTEIESKFTNSIAGQGGTLSVQKNSFSIAISSTLGGGKNYCVDSAGYSGAGSALPSGTCNPVADTPGDDTSVVVCSSFNDNAAGCPVGTVDNPGPCSWADPLCVDANP